MRCSAGSRNDWRTRDCSTGKTNRASTRRPLKRMRRCEASCAGTLARRTRSSCSGWPRRRGFARHLGGRWHDFDALRKKKGSNQEWKSPADPDAKITKMKDGRTHLAHKTEQAVDMTTGAIVAVTIQGARPRRHIYADQDARAGRDPDRACSQERRRSLRSGFAGSRRGQGLPQHAGSSAARSRRSAWLHFRTGSRPPQVARSTSSAAKRCTPIVGAIAASEGCVCIVLRGDVPNAPSLTSTELDA